MAVMAVMAATLRRCDVQVHLVVLCCAGGTTSYELWRLQSWDLQPRRCSVPGTWFKGGEINGITESELRNRRKRSNKPQNCAIEGYEILTRYQLPVPGTRFYRQYQVPDRLWPVLYIRRGLFFRWHSELVQFTRQRHHVNNVNNVNISQSMWQQNIVEGKRRICDEVRIHLLLSLYLYFSVTIDLHLTYQRLYLVKSLLLTASTFTWTVWPCWMKPLMYPYHVPGTRYQVIVSLSMRSLQVPTVRLCGMSSSSSSIPELLAWRYNGLLPYWPTLIILARISPLQHPASSIQHSSFGWHQTVQRCILIQYRSYAHQKSVDESIFCIKWDLSTTEWVTDRCVMFHCCFLTWSWPTS